MFVNNNPNYTNYLISVDVLKVIYKVDRAFRYCNIFAHFYSFRVLSYPSVAFVTILLRTKPIMKMNSVLHAQNVGYNSVKVKSSKAL